MDTSPFLSPSYSTASLVLIGLFVSTLFLAAIISLLYWINTRMRRGMKWSRDDWRVEKDIDAGHTLHAEGIIGGRHPDEGGLHLDQEDPHSPLDALKPGLKHRHAPFEDNRRIF